MVNDAAVGCKCLRVQPGWAEPTTCQPFSGSANSPPLEGGIEGRDVVQAAVSPSLVRPGHPQQGMGGVGGSTGPGTVFRC